MRVRGTSGRSAAQCGGRAPAAGTARARQQQRKRKTHTENHDIVRNSAIAMRFISRAGWAEVVDLGDSRPCGVVGGPSSALVNRAFVSRAEPFVICGGRARWTERKRSWFGFPQGKKKKLAIASATRDGIRDRATGWVICGGLAVARHPRGDLDGGWCQQTPKRACFSTHEQRAQRD